MKNALMTGSTGFIGYHLTKKLLENGYNVRCLLRKTSNTAKLKELAATVNRGKIEFITSDSLSDKKNNYAIVRSLDYIDEVFHLAAATHGFSREIYDSNVEVTRNLLDICQNSYIKRFNFVSSIAARAPAGNGLISEESLYRPLSPYGKSKMEAEQMVRDSQVPFTIYSPAVVVGEGDREMIPIYRMIKRNGLSFKVGFRDQRLGFIYAGDLTNAILMATNSDKTLGKNYIVSDGMQYTQRAYLKKIGKSLGREEIKVIPLPLCLVYSAAGIVELWAKISGNSNIVSISKISEMKESWVCQPSQKIMDDTGWKPKVSLDESIQRTAEWLAQSEMGF